MCTVHAQNKTFDPLDSPTRIPYIKCQLYTNKKSTVVMPGPLSSWAFSIYNGD